MTSQNNGKEQIDDVDGGDDVYYVDGDGGEDNVDGVDYNGGDPEEEDDSDDDEDDPPPSEYPHSLDQRFQL